MANFEVPVGAYMSSPIVAIRRRDDLVTVRRHLAENQISALPVVDEHDRVVGVISRTDLLRAGRREAGSRLGASLLTLPDRTAEDEMTREVVIVSQEATLASAARLMVTERVHRVVVEDRGIPVGILSTRDVMRVIREKRVNRSLGGIMSSPLFTIRAGEPVSLATDRLARAHVSGLVVVDGDWPVGVFTQVEALEARDLPRETATEEVMSAAILVLDERIPVHRAAAQAGAMGARRIIVSRDGEPVGIVSGLDFAAVVAGTAPEE